MPYYNTLPYYITYNKLSIKSKYRFCEIITIKIDKKGTYLHNT